MQTISEKRKLDSLAFKRTRNGAEDQPTAYEWTVEQYYRMGDLGFFDGKRVELIGGKILEMAPMKAPHATVVQLLSDILTEIFSKGFRVRQQLPLGFSDKNEPEPDVAIVKGNVRDFLVSHPAAAVLVVEVSDATLQFDRKVKASLYAEFGIKEYWIVNIKSRQLEVYRNPTRDAAGSSYYAEQTIYREDQSVATLAKPKSRIKVADILP